MKLSLDQIRNITQGTKVTSIDKSTKPQSNETFETVTHGQLKLMGTTRHFMEDDLKEIFVRIFNDTFKDKELIVSNLETVIEELTNIDEIEEKLSELKEQEIQAGEYIRLWIKENSRRVIDQDVYEEEYIKRAEKVKEIQSEISKLSDERTLLLNKKKEAENSLKLITEHEMLTEFDEELFAGLIESITVFDDRLVFEWKDGGRVDDEL